MQKFKNGEEVECYKSGHYLKATYVGTCKNMHVVKNNGMLIERNDESIRPTQLNDNLIKELKEKDTYIKDLESVVRDRNKELKEKDDTIGDQEADLQHYKILKESCEEKDAEIERLGAIENDYKNKIEENVQLKENLIREDDVRLLINTDDFEEFIINSLREMRL